MSTSRPPPPTHSFYTPEELSSELGLAAFGENVRVSRKASIYGGENIRLGSNVRIDDFCVITATGPFTVEDYVHIAAFCFVSSRGGITMRSFSGLSARCTLYSASDDYSGEHLTNPTVPEAYLGVTVAPVVIGRHVIVGCGSTVLPGVEIGDGSAVGAHSLVTRSLPTGIIAAGTPARAIRPRRQRLLELERQLLDATRGESR